MLAMSQDKKFCRQHADLKESLLSTLKADFLERPGSVQDHISTVPDISRGSMSVSSEEPSSHRETRPGFIWDNSALMSTTFVTEEPSSPMETGPSIGLDVMSVSEESGNMCPTSTVLLAKEPSSPTETGPGISRDEISLTAPVAEEPNSDISLDGISVSEMSDNMSPTPTVLVAEEPSSPMESGPDISQDGMSVSEEPVNMSPTSTVLLAKEPSSPMETGPGINQDDIGELGSSSTRTVDVGDMLSGSSDTDNISPTSTVLVAKEQSSPMETESGSSDTDNISPTSTVLVAKEQSSPMETGPGINQDDIGELCSSSTRTVDVGDMLSGSSDTDNISPTSTVLAAEEQSSPMETGPGISQDDVSVPEEPDMSPTSSVPVAEEPSSPTETEAEEPRSPKQFFKPHAIVSKLTTVLSVHLKPIGHFKMCGNCIPVIEWEGVLYFPIPDCLCAVDMPNYIDNRGYKSICAALDTLKPQAKHCLITFPTAGAGSDKRWIKKCSLRALFRSTYLFRKKRAQIDLFLRLLCRFKPVLSQRGHSTLSSSSGTVELELGSTEEACLGIEPQGETCITPYVETTGSVFFKGQLTTYVVHDQKIYAEINMFPFIRDHINQRSYHFMDSCLVRAGLVPQACYITTSQMFKRSHIHTKALLLLLKKSFRHHKLDCEMAIAAIADLKDDII